MHNNSKIYPLEIDQILRIHKKEQNWDFPYLNQIPIADLPYFCGFIDQLLTDIETVVGTSKDEISAFCELNSKYEEYQHYRGSLLHFHICSHICALKDELDNDERKASTAVDIYQDHLILSKVLPQLKNDLPPDNGAVE